MKRRIVIIVYCILILLSCGLGFYFKMFNTTLDKESEVDVNNQGEISSGEERSHDQSDYYLLIPSTTYDDRVYNSNKVLSSDLSDELMTLGAINYISVNFPEKAHFIAGGKDSSELYIPVDIIKEYIPILYGRELSGELPTGLSATDSQFSLWYLEDSNKYSYVCYEVGCYSFPFWHGYDPLVIFDEMETVGEYTYIYDSALPKGYFDGSYGAITIGDRDSSDGIMIETTDIEEVYERYPNYFKKYKHTFRNNEDGSISYISTERLD